MYTANSAFAEDADDEKLNDSELYSETVEPYATVILNANTGKLNAYAKIENTSTNITRTITKVNEEGAPLAGAVLKIYLKENYDSYLNALEAVDSASTRKKRKLLLKLSLQQ